MMLRLPFGVPVWQLIVSLSLLLGAFGGITYLSSKIFRIGILMYGKKITLKELVKWMYY
jgi:ABC-2 type transport system permease protein